MEMEHNPNLELDTRTRQFYTGQMLHASLPFRWYSALSENDSPIGGLISWSVQTEQHMYLSARSEEEYNEFVKETVTAARDVDLEFKRDNVNTCGIVPPEHPAFPICQYLCQTMELSKNAGEDEALAHSLMLVAAGILDIQEPRFHGGNRNFYGDKSIRLTVVCLLLRTVFPAPYPGEEYNMLTEIIDFGYQLEEEVYLRSNSIHEYYTNLRSLKRQLMEFRMAENMFLENQIQMMEYFFVPGMLEYLRNGGRLANHNNNNNQNVNNNNDNNN